MTTEVRLLVVIASALLSASCGAAFPSNEHPSAAPDMQLIERQSDLQLKNGAAGVQEIMPMDGRDHYSLAFQIGNDSGRPAVIDSIKLVGAKGLMVGEDFAVGRPRQSGGMDSDIRYPPRREWPTSSEEPLEGVHIAASGDDADWGIIAVFEITQTEPFAYARVWKVEGTLGGEPFVDYVYTGYAVCETPRVTKPCQRFANENTPPLDLGRRPT